MATPITEIYNKFYAALLKLLPRGKAWEGQNIKNLMKAIALEIKTVHEDLEDLHREMFPESSYDSVPDFEYMLGLPEYGQDLPATISERRQNILAKLRAQGGQTPEYFVEILESFGHSGTVTDDYIPFTVGKSSAGDSLYGYTWAFAFLVSITDTSASDPIMEYMINKYKPAHTVAMFEYGA